MKILHFITQNTVAGDVNIFVKNLVEEQIRQGTNAKILVFRPTPDRDCYTLNASDSYMYDAADLIQRFHKTLEHFKPDIIHAHGPTIQILDQVNYKKPVVYTAHSDTENAFSGPRVYTQNALSRPNVTCVTLGEKLSMAFKRYWSKTDVVAIPNGVSQTEATNYGAKKYFSVIGRVCKSKQHRLIIDTIPKNAKTMVLGDGPQKQILQDFCLKHRPEIMFVGHSDFTHMHLQQTKVLITFSEYEGDPLIIKEAMMAGVPVISRRVGTAEEVITKRTGWLVNKQSELKQLLERLHTSDGSEIAMKSHLARERAKEFFGIELCTSKYTDLYKLVSAKDNRKNTSIFVW